MSFRPLTSDEASQLYVDGDAIIDYLVVEHGLGRADPLWQIVSQLKCALTTLASDEPEFVLAAIAKAAAITRQS